MSVNDSWETFAWVWQFHLKNWTQVWKPQVLTQFIVFSNLTSCFQYLITYLTSIFHPKLNVFSIIHGSFTPPMLPLYLFHLITQVQTIIVVHWNQDQELDLAEQWKWQCIKVAIGNEDIGSPYPLDADSFEHASINKHCERPVDKYLNGKHQALEEVINPTKLQWAPRVVQPSVGQESKGYSPQYCTHWKAIVTEGLSGGNIGKENGQRPLSQLRK
jgi:hypothetical protein